MPSAVADSGSLATSTMNRARIEEVRIVQNTEDRFEVERAVHDHRGKAEGKKVGSFEIVRIA